MRNAPKAPTNRHTWTKAELQMLRERYPDTDTKILAKELRTSVARINYKANQNGIHKSHAYLSESATRKLAERRENIEKAELADAEKIRQAAAQPTTIAQQIKYPHTCLTKHGYKETKPCAGGSITTHRIFG